MPANHFNSKHGAGRGRSLRTGLAKYMPRHRRRRTRRRKFLAEQLEARLLLAADLTVITHGRMDQIFADPDVAPEWAFDLASAINERDALGFSQDQIDNSVMRYDATDYSPPANGASAFLIFNWAEISDIDSPGKADDDEVAGVLADMVRARYPSNGDPIDIHFIGHSRGSYVTLETVNRLNTSADNARIGELSMTTLDPQDYGIPGLNEENIELVVPSNVDFAENYYQSLFPLGGGEMQGADIDQSLTIPLALWDGRSVLLGAEHLEVVDHYYWSIDTDDSTSASYLRDSDLQDQQAVFEAELASGVTETRDLLYGESPLVRRIEESAAILEGIAQEFGDGVGEFFTEFTDRLETVFGEVEVPIISDQLSQIISPVVDDLKNFGADVRDLLGDVVEVASRTLDSDPLEVLQGAMYLVLGPGSEGLEDLSDAAAYALAPLASRFDRINLGLLLDRSDAGDDIGPSDVVITTGNEFGVYDDDNLLGSGEAPWFQLDFRIGQFEVIDLPKFDLGLESLSQNAALQAFFDTFGFQVTSENGLRTNLRWDLRMGLGVRGLPGQLITERIFFNSGATGSGLDTGNGVDEFQASITVFAAPPNSRGSETFATSIADSTTTNDLRGEVNLGLFQGTITDGTAFKVKITATQGVDFEDFDGPNSLTIVVNEGLADQRTIVLTAPDPTADLVTFLLDLNGQLIDEYDGIPEVGFTVDFGSVHRQVDPAIPTTPSLVLAANDPDIQSLTIRGGQKYKFLAEQYEDGRSTTLGFGNNVSSDEDDDGDNTRLTATLPIPANGVSMAKPNFVLWIGGERNAQDGRLLDDATSVVVAEALNGDVASLDGLQQNMALLRRINSPEAYRAAIEQLIQSLVDSQTNFGRDAVRVELVTINGKQHLQLVSDQRLTVTYKGIEQTQLTLTAGIDIQDPNFDPALLEQNPNDEAYFNRLTISEIRSNDITDVFSPVLKGEATVRLHVDTNTDTLDGFLEQALGVSDATLGLPTVDFDFIFDAAIDFTEFFGEGTSELDDIFSIDALQFDNVVLDAEALVQNVIVPIIDTVFSAFEPVFEIFGDVADDAEALLNQRIPVVSDLVGEDITVMSILEEIGLDEFLTALLALPGLPADLIEAAEDPSFGAFNLGGWELVMDPDSPLFFPDIDLPVPIDLAYAYNTLEAVEALDFLSVFTALDTFKASGLSIDIFKPKSIINMAIGQPFDIISYGLPNINIDTGAEFDFDWKVIDFAASANLILQSRLRVVYDSLGIEKIVDAFRENATPDWSDLIDGFGITTVSADEDIEDPDTDHECEKDFEKEIYICIALEAQGGVDIGVAEGSGGIAIQADLGLDLEDPDEDGKLRLDEILDITNDFANPENLFCIFDIEGSASLDLNGSFTVAGIEIFDGEFDWDSGDLSLQDLLSSLFNICTDEVPSPILAQEIVEGTDTVLRLNTGPFASARLYEDTDDSDGRVEYTVTQQNSTYSITAVLYPGGESYTQEITGDFDRIIATGSRFGDTFNLSGVATSVHIDGRDGNDTLIGGTGADRLEGSAGDDNLQGGGGNDMLLPGRGRNQVSDGPGDDEVDFRLNDVGVVYTTGGGNDIVLGSRYDDDIRAGAGSAAVRFEGGRGDDILVGGDSADTLMGGDGDDRLQGMGGNDILVGGFGNDTLLGGTGADTLDGGQGDDVLDGGAGADSLEAGQGNDEVTAGLQDVMVQGGSGTADSLHFVMDEYPHSGRLTRNRYLESSGDVPYYGFETMDVELGDGSGGQVYVLDIDGVNIPLSSVRGGAGPDTVTIRQLAPNDLAALIELGGEDDVLRIINSQRQLVVSGGQNLSNGDRLIVDRTNDPVSREGSVAADVLFGFGNSVIRYDNFEFLDIELGSGTDRVTVADTNSLTSTTLRGGEGDDQFLIQTISSETTIVGGPGEDLATLLIPGNPNLLTADDYGDLRLTVERLQIDNREYGSTGVIQPVAWVFENNDVFVSATKILESVAADTVIFLGGQGSNDQLTVRDSVAVPQTVTVDGSRVTIEEGFNVLSFDQQREFSRFNVAPTVDGLDGVTATVISPDGQYVYASSAVDDAVSVYRVTADPANPIINALDFVQVLKNGQLGVSGIDAASDIAISSNGTHVYVASGSTQSIGVFERLPQNGRLVYRGAYSGGLGAIRGIAVAPNGNNLYGVTGTHLFRLARNPQTGLLSIGDSRAFANANAIAADNQNVFLAAGSRLSHWRLGPSGGLQSETDSFSRSYTDVSIDSLNRRVFATFDGGVSEFSFSASGLGAPRDQAYLNPINKTQGLVVEYDADDQRLVTSFDSNSVDPNPPNPPQYALDIISLYAEGDGQDRTEFGGSDAWELYVKLFIVPTPTTPPVFQRFPDPDEANAFTDFEESGTTVTDFGAPVPLATGAPTTIIVELWEEDALASDDLLGQIIIDFNDNLTNRRFTVNVRDDDEIVGFATLRVGVINQAPPPDATPTTESVVLFGAPSPGPGINSGVQRDYSRASLDHISTSPTSSDFYGAHTAADELTRFFGSNSRKAISDGSTQSSFSLPAQPGMDDVETVVSLDGAHVYATSGRYGTISVYSRNASTGEVGSSPIQVIDAGLLPGASLAMTQASNILQNSDPQFLYVANPAADSIYVYRRQPSQAANYGELTLVQVVTDGLNGVDGIAGVSDLKLTDRNNQPQLFVAGKDDDAIAVFSVNQQTGLLSFQSSQTHPDLDGPSQLVLAGRAEASGSPSVPVNLMVITEENNKLVVFDRSFDGSLTHLQSFSDVADPSAIVTSSRPLTPRIDLKDTVFVASASDSSIAVYERDAFISGQLELIQVLREGRDGVRGIQGVRELAFHPGNQRDFLYAGDGQESLAVFRIAQDELIQLQRLRDGTAGVNGISNVTGLTVVDGDLIVGSGGPTAGGPGGFSVLSASLISPSAIPNDYVVEYAAMEALIVQSGPDNDLVHAGEVEIPFTLNTGAGDDLTTVRNTPAGSAGFPIATTISLGGDNDELNLLSVSSYSTTTVNAEGGRDSLRLFATEPNSMVTLNGGLDGDTFDITGRRLQSNVSVNGQSPNSLASDGNHDVLCFDPRSPGVTNPTTDPETPTRGDGSIKISAADFGVNYTSIEAFCADFAAPLASIEPVNSIMEGQGVTFDARQTLISPAHVAATYIWSIGPNEGIAQGSMVNFSWDDLVAAGVDDDGRYQVRVMVTSRDSAGLLYTDIATADLNITNAAPTFDVPSGSGEQGIPYEFELAALDPGNDTISTWFIDWGDGSLPSRFFGDVATASHVYATTGSFQISVVGQDEDGTWAFSPPGDVTVLAAPSVRGKTQSIEGSDYLLELLNPGGRPIERWLIDWGDGTQSEAGPGSTTLVHQFADNGLYEIAATILRDGQTITLPTSTVVSVDNAAPTIVADSSRLTANQGESIPITFRANDPGLRDGAWMFEIDRDVNGLVDILQPTDNLTTDKNGFNGTIELAFASVGEHRIAARVRDKDDGLSSPAFVSIDVQNVPPTIHSVTAPTGREANLVRVFVDATDPGGAQDRLTYQFDFDNDGLYEVETNVNSASFVPADNGTFPVNVRVVDSHGGAAVSSIEVAVDNLPPTYLRPSVSGQVIEGTLTTISVVGSDPAGDNDPLTYFFDLDNDGIFETVNSTGAVQYAFGDDGVYEVPIQIHDDDGGVTDVRVQRSVLDEDSGTSITVFGNLQVVVINGNPTITSIQTTNIAENETAVVTGTFTDPALGIPTETFEGSATWSDGVSTPLIVRPDGSFETSRFFPDDDPSGTPVDQFTVEIVIRDDDGGTSFEEACTQTDSNGDCIETRRTPVTSPAISVANIPPVITSLVSDAASLEEKSDDKIVHISGSYSDIGLLDTHDAIVDWGDGSSPEPIVLNPVLGTFAASHEYATGGVYQIVVTVTDDDTGVSVPASVAAVLRGVGVVDGTLFIVGTDGRDKVDFKLDPRSDALLVDVKLNQTSEEDDKNEAETDYEERIRRTYQASSIERVIAFLCGGDDHYEGGMRDDAGSDSRSAYNIRQIVFGGDGRDLLHGGPWNDALLGNAGEDNIKGRDGSGILIGGADRDRAIGEDADDLLIGGTARGDISSISFAEQVDQALAFWAEDDLNAALTLLSPLADDGQRDNLSGKKGDNVIIEGDEEQWNSSSLWLGAPPALYQNSAESRFDVNRDGYTTALDVLLLVNYLNSNATSNKGSSAGTVYDVSNDGHISPMDVLYVINRLNAKSAEGESAGASFNEQSWLPADSVLYMDFLDALGRRKVQVGLQP